MASQHLYNIYVCLVESPLLATSKVLAEIHTPYITYPEKGPFGRLSGLTLWRIGPRSLGSPCWRSLQWYVPKTDAASEN